MKAITPAEKCEHCMAFDFDTGELTLLESQVYGGPLPVCILDTVPEECMGPFAREHHGREELERKKKAG